MSQTLLEQFVLLSIFLMIGYAIRVWVTPIRKLFLPASLIGGVIGLILLPNGFGIIPISEEWMGEFASLPGVLITVVITASILGIKFPKAKEMAGGVGRQFMHLNLILFAQIGLGLLVGAAFLGVTYQTFGFEMFAGFVGGHGTAAMLANSLNEMGVEWWLDSQGVALTMATVGIVGGILVGIAMMQYVLRKGYIKSMSNLDNLPDEVIKGYAKPEEAKPLGKSIQFPPAIEPFAFTLALVLITVGLAFQVRGLFVGTIIHHVAPWAWGIILMAIIWLVMCKIGFDWIIDSTVKARIMGTFVDYLVVAAIISLPISTVAGYIVPMLVLSIVGMAFMIVATLYFGKKMLPGEDWFERSIINFGNCTGVGATGVLLLRLVDPDFNTNALSNWSLSFAIISLYVWFIFAFMPLFMIQYGLFTVGVAFCCLAIAFIIFARFIPGFWNLEQSIAGELKAEEA